MNKGAGAHQKVIYNCLKRKCGLKGSPVEVKAKPQALDQASAARIWSVSEDLTGVRYSALD